MVMQVRRTLTAGAVPTGLAEGQLSVGMADAPPTGWVGVPTSVNPAGVIPITGLVRTVAGAPQPAGALGQLWWDEDAAQLFVYTGSEWVVAVNPPLPDVSVFAKSMTATVAPSGPAAGDFWFNPSTGWLQIWNGTAWVSTVYKIPGVTDGSIAAPGEVGEIISTYGGPITIGNGVLTTLTTLVLPAGAWSITGSISFSFQMTAGQLVTEMTSMMNNVGFDAFLTPWGLAITYYTASMTPLTVNISAPGSYSIQARTFCTANVASCNYGFVAQRIR